MDDAYSVQTTAAETAEADGLEQLMALKDADTFCVADQWGEIAHVHSSQVEDLPPPDELIEWCATCNIDVRNAREKRSETSQRPRRHERSRWGRSGGSAD